LAAGDTRRGDKSASLQKKLLENSGRCAILTSIVLLGVDVIRPGGYTPSKALLEVPTRSNGRSARIHLTNAVPKPVGPFHSTKE
jgi:hypothetical protein